MNRRRGFTLIEMSVVITIIVVLASMVAPRISTFMDTRSVLTFVNGLPGFAGEARLAAIKQNQTAKIQYDGGQNQLTITVEQPSGGGDQQIDYMPVPKSLQVVDFQAAGQASNASAWIIHFYPDGTSDGGGLETNDHNRVRSLAVDTYGNGHLVNGQIPDQSQDKWPAGTYDTRQN